MNIYVDDYEKFYRFVFEKAVEIWRSTSCVSTILPAQLFRTNWYEVGTIDEWDLTDPKVKKHLKDKFDQDIKIKQAYIEQTHHKFSGADQQNVADEAWELCFNEFKEWYQKKKDRLAGMVRFHYAVKTSTDFIDIIECGHWKVNLLHKILEEKGLDTKLAVDMLAKKNSYDVALVVSGDADSIPSINYVKSLGKHVGAIEFLGGYPPENRGRNFSSKLKMAADFVVQVYAMDLVSKGIARKQTPTIAYSGGQQEV